MLKRFFMSALAVGLLPACGLEPVPRVAVEGTTIAIAVPKAFDVGHGRALTSGASPPSVTDVTSLSQLTGPPIDPSNMAIEDLQRGEIVAVLVDELTSTPVAVLDVPTVAAVNLDPSADHIANSPSNYAAQRQNIVFVEIPLAREDGTELVTDLERSRRFSIELRRFRRQGFGSSQTTFELVPQRRAEELGAANWLGWAFAGTGDPLKGIEIEIVDAPGDFAQGQEELAYTSFTGYTLADQGSGPTEYSSSFDPSVGVPAPYFLVVFAASNGHTALEFDFEYPAERMQITEVRPNRGGGWVGISPAPSPAPACSPSPVPQRATVHVADPEKKVEAVVVYYELKDDVVGCDTAPVTIVATASSPIPDVTVDAASVKAWDVDGNPIAPPTYQLNDRSL